MNSFKFSLQVIVLLFFFNYFSDSLNAQNYCGSDPVSVHGALSVEGSRIVDQNNEPVSFAGNSLFWSNTGWGGDKYFNADVVSWLEEDWNSTIVRAVMGVEDVGGYISHPVSNKNRVKSVVDAAIANDMYVIIDWHSHHAEENQAAAISFFQEMAETYGSYPNVIYEIYNEPLQISWSNTIKPYAEAVTAAIRAIDPDNLIIVGTPTWSQDVDVASNDPITGYSNIAYTLHFYAGTHGQSLRQKAQTAMNNGIAIMVTEYGTVDADGDGGVNHASTDEWMSFLQANDITHLNWSINDKAEGASALVPGASANGGWSANQLTESGAKIKSIIENWTQYCSSDGGNNSGGNNGGDNHDGGSIAYPNGVPHNIPGTINATNYDTGGAGVSYFDIDAGNNGNGPRQNEDVDTDEGNVGWIAAGEWIDFTVDVQTAGTYNISYEVATLYNGQFRLEFDGQDVTGPIDVEDTGGWGYYRTITSQNVSLSSGQQTMRAYFIEGPFNIGDITFDLTNSNSNSSEPMIVNATGIGISPTSLTMNEGETTNVSGYIVPLNATDPSVTWSSDNPGVAKVNDTGTVTAVSAGSAIITVRTTDGGHTASTAVTVNSVNNNEGGEGNTTCNPVPINLSFSHDGAGSYCWEISGKIDYINSWGASSITINGVDFTNKWANNMPPRIDGKYFVEFSSTNSWGHFEATGANASRIDNSGINSETAVSAVRLYPNPSNGVFIIKNELFADKYSVDIYSTQGELVYRHGIVETNNVNINAPLEPGLYFLVLTEGNLSVTRKLIIK